MNQTKWFRVFGNCTKCGQRIKARSMVSCQECKIMRYCSVMCMGIDKDFHKNECGRHVTADPVETKHEPNVYTHVPSEDSKTKETIKQEAEFATGSHDVSAEEISDEAIDERDTTKTSICAFCKNISSQLLVCSKCSNVKYCNIECQKQDFKRHKLLCFSSMKGGIIKMKQRLKNAVGEGPCVHCHCFKPINTLILCDSCCVTYCCKDCQRKNFLDHYNFCEILSVFHRLDGFIVDQVPPANLQKYACPSPRVPRFFIQQIHLEAKRHLNPAALLQIIGWFSTLCPAIIARDGVKDEVHIIFHDTKKMASMSIKHKDETAELRMSSLDDCLKPGNFIVLAYVLSHNLVDGTYGFHVDDLDTVHFIQLE